MGRLKSLPVRRWCAAENPHRDSAANVTFVPSSVCGGRLFEDATPIAMRIAVELAETIEEQQERQKKRVAAANRQRKQAMPTIASVQAQITAKEKKRGKDKLKYRRSQRLQTKQKRKLRETSKPPKNVHFCLDDQLVTFIPTCELVIVKNEKKFQSLKDVAYLKDGDEDSFMDEELDKVDDRYPVILRYRPKSDWSVMKDDVENNDVAALFCATLYGTLLQIEKDGDTDTHVSVTQTSNNQSNQSSRMLPVTSALAIRDLWKCYPSFLCEPSGDVLNKFLDALCICVQEGWLRLYLEESNSNACQEVVGQDNISKMSPSYHVKVHLFLTSRAVLGCSVATIERPCPGTFSSPVRTNCFNSKQPVTSRCFQDILAVLYPSLRAKSNKCSVANTARKARTEVDCAGKERNDDEDKDDGKTIITAKQIYALTDNRQLQRVMDQKVKLAPRTDGAETMGLTGENIYTVPDLVPTLRPYQRAAVDWMLEREYMTEDGEEWKAAWVVLQLTDNTTGQQLTDNTMSQQPTEKRSSQFSSAVPFASVVTPLKAWEDLSSKNSDNNTVDFIHQSQFCLLYCPVTGWLTTCLAQAKDLIMGSNENDSVEDLVDVDSAPCCKGGILAESMGLGKTVEVLACILSHRRVPLPPTESCSVVQQIDSNYKDVIPATMHINKENQNGKEVNELFVGHVNNISEFGDADMSSVDEEELSPCTSRNEQKVILESVSTATRVVNVAAAGTESVNHATTPTALEVVQFTSAPVTPEKECPVFEERWVDHDVLGSCICGEVIAFSSASLDIQGNILICKGCEEPLHKDCSAYDSVAGLQAVRFRKTFSELTLDCKFCDVCPCCLAGRSSVVSSATLIITPPAILQQWETEIQRHTKNVQGHSLKVVIYDGIEKACKKPQSTRSNGIKLLHPENLAKADIVLMTFSALMSDLGHSDDNRFVANDQDVDFGAIQGLRNRKRYRVVPSPLLSIKWWRVCLDEAQRVEAPTAGSARMALKLKAVHRWCITGTPVGRGKLDDLYGLLLFLRIQPFAHKRWFNKCFSTTFPGVLERIEVLLRHCFWRSTKSFDSVKQQMGVPDQIERKIKLRLSSIEKHFYNQQLEKTLAAAGDISEVNIESRKRKASQLDILAEHLHRLRAACCHPQVGSSGVRANKKNRSVFSFKSGPVGSNTGLTNRVMTMEQILDRFIDDARLKCEEAQRLATMHTNAMASITRLKIDVKDRGVSVSESDASLLVESGRLYMESLLRLEENATPTLAIGEAILSGSQGFCAPRTSVRSGTGELIWKVTNLQLCEPHGTVEFEGPARKLIQFKLKSISEIPEVLSAQVADNFIWRILKPKLCVFQVSSLAVGGEFIDVASITLPRETGTSWFVEGGFRTNKSKSWRFVVKSFYPSSNIEGDSFVQPDGKFAGVQFELYEANIASDPLQRLHSLHNGSLSFEAALDCNTEDLRDSLSSRALSIELVNSSIESFRQEAKLIESLYLEHISSIHRACMIRMHELTISRQECEGKLIEAFNQMRGAKSELVDCWDDGWWEDFIGIINRHGSDMQQRWLYERLVQDIEGSQVDGDVLVKFPEFGDLAGFGVALQWRIGKIRSGLGKEGSRRSHTGRAVSNTKDDNSLGFVQPKSLRFKCSHGAVASCMQAISELSSNPDAAEIFENTHCHVCKADWFQTGPKCRHCKLGEILQDLIPDSVTLQVLGSLHSALKSACGSFLPKLAKITTCVVTRANFFFEVLEAEKRERVGAWRMWRTHLDLLNDLDELNQCKSSTRLSYENEDLSKLTDEQMNAVVIPIDINAKYHDHAAKQAMALGDLRRAKETLRFLKNQNNERNDGQNYNSNADNCVVCLSAFEDERAVLRCGHSFHQTPCLENMQARKCGSLISCPMRCRLKTDPRDVMFATTKAKDDGSHSARKIIGSWGTKVTRLVSDVLDVREMGEKCVVFTQWEDMLGIVHQALTENDICVARILSSNRFGEAIRRFRTAECTVLLLNVKNGAEGLTLVEATHVFMVEPLLNCGLDSQAINRVHRIGQNQKTCVWRYLVEDTIETKIDKLRMEHQEDQLEDAINAGKKSTYNAGGIDGGFRSQEELFAILR